MQYIKGVNTTLTWITQPCNKLCDASPIQIGPKNFITGDIRPEQEILSGKKRGKENGIVEQVRRSKCS